MSNNDSLDEETKRILAEVDADDSKESEKPDDSKKDKRKDYPSNKDDKWETNSYEDDDSNW